MFFLSCGTLSRPFSLVFVKTLPKEERPSRKRKKEEYNKKRRDRSCEFVKGRSSIYRKTLGYYSTIHLPFYPYFTISSTHTITPTHTITYLSLGYARQGSRKSSSSNSFCKPNQTIRTGCKASFNAKLVDIKWCVASVHYEHNHHLSPRQVRFFRCNKDLDHVAKSKLEINDRT
jgi:hypothetical protein